MRELTVENERLKDIFRGFPDRLKALDSSELIVVGDVGLDEYVTGEVKRISPEAPVPIVEVHEQVGRLGLAANVAQNVVSLGGRVKLVGVVGNDSAAEQLKIKLKASGVDPQYLVVDSERPTTRKLRVMSGPHHIVRVDFEKKQYLSSTVELALLAQVEALLPKAKGVVIEDYAKGVLSEQGLQSIIQAARKGRKPVFVDPNRFTPAGYYRGADVITPNRDEAIEMSGLHFDDLTPKPDWVAQVGQALREKTLSSHIILTRGSEGMSLIGLEETVHMPTFARQVFDVTGAGDTVVAALALAHVSGFSLIESCVFGNVAAGYVVGQIGCVPCTRENFLSYLERLLRGS